MTQQKESVVSTERFAGGMTWEQYLGHIKRNRTPIPKHSWQPRTCRPGERMRREQPSKQFERLHRNTP